MIMQHIIQQRKKNLFFTSNVGLEKIITNFQNLKKKKKRSCVFNLKRIKDNDFLGRKVIEFTWNNHSLYIRAYLNFKYRMYLNHLLK